MFSMEKKFKKAKNVTTHKISTYEFFHKKRNYFHNLANRRAKLMEMGGNPKNIILDIHF